MNENESGLPAGEDQNPEALNNEHDNGQTPADSAASTPEQAADETTPAETPEEAKPAETSPEVETITAKTEEEPAEEHKQHTPAPKPQPVEIDWNKLGKKEDSYSVDERQKYESQYGETLKSITENEVLDGTIVGKTHKDLVINIGYKSDGVIPLSEVRYNPDIKIGDKLEVYVESQEDEHGQLVLSHRKARATRSWDKINSAMANDEIITGFVKCRTKGGLIADVFGIEAFLPGSQIDVKPIRDYDVYVGKTMEFKVVKINHEFKNVVVSHKALIEAELEIQKREIISKLEKGQILEGTVKNITTYGVFIGLGGVDGLIHITDLSWGRISHPEEVVKLDDKINVVILDFDENKKRIALGLKQLTPHPWEKLDASIVVGSTIKGKVVVLADYGAFVEVAPGVEGLVHVSEMSWSQHLRSAQDFLKTGAMIEAKILTLDRDERKMSLGIKQLMPDPWGEIAAKYVIGSKHTGKVMNFTNFGIFVELEEGVDGLVHISDLSWSKRIKHPAEFTNIGDKMDVVVLGIDTDNRRLSLGHKQLEDNPWEVFETIFTIGSVHKGTVVSFGEKGGALIALPYGVEGFAPHRHLLKQNGKTAEVEDMLDFKVIEFNKDNKQIIVSHTKVYTEIAETEKQAEMEKKKVEETETGKAMKKVSESIQKSTLGDDDTLSNLKTEMEQTEKVSKAAKKAKQKETEATAESSASEVKPVEETKPEEPTATVEEGPVSEVKPVEETKPEEPEPENHQPEESKPEEPKDESKQE